MPDQRPENSLSAKTCFCSAVPCAINRLALPRWHARADVTEAMAKALAATYLGRVQQLHAADVLICAVLGVPDSA